MKFTAGALNDGYNTSNNNGDNSNNNNNNNNSNSNNDKLNKRVALEVTP
jgi:hypothetical protein